MKIFCTLAGCCGLIGAVLLIVSFVINPGPPPSSSGADLQAFGEQHRTAILLGAWLQTVSPPMIVIFGVALAYLGGERTRFATYLTLFGGVVLSMVSLVEVVFYLNAVSSASPDEATLSLHFIHAVQHLFSMVAAPLVFLPLSIAILRSGVLSPAFAYTGIALGVLFAVLGGLVLFYPWQHLVDDLAYSQGVWWMAASTSLVMRAGRIAAIAHLPPHSPR